MQNDLLLYIQKSFEVGVSAEKIKEALLAQGWDEKDVNLAVGMVQEKLKEKAAVPLAPPAPPKKSQWDLDLKDLTASQILLYLGGLIVLIAGITYIGLNWSAWGAIPRILAILMPTLICFISGIHFWPQPDHQKQGAYLMGVGSLLFPLFLGVTFRELKIFDEAFSPEFNLSISLICMVLYGVLYRIYKFEIWILFAYTAGISFYYNFLQIIGIDKFLGSAGITWLMIILGTGYVLSALEFERINLKGSNYIYPLGMIVLALSALNLGVESFTTIAVTFGLMLLGITYFILGMWIEKNNLKKYCDGVYALGMGLVFFSLIRYGLDGTFFKPFLGDAITSDARGLSFVVIGIICIVLSKIIYNLGNMGFPEGKKYNEFFDLLGPILLLGAIFQLGLGDSKPIYETLLLLTSVAFIFGSIPAKAKHYLFIGTLFLIIYIFAIGGEYFEDQVGWPLTLFVAGLSSMGVSIAMEKVRRQYFLTK